MAHQVFDRARFITFNYDGTLEHFMTYAIKNFFDVPLEHAAKVVDNADIVHPYGTVGKLDSTRTPSVRTRFGHLDDQGFVERAAGIRTYTEEMRDWSDKQRIYDLVNECPVVVFLGFAFHEQNVRLMLPPEEAQSPKDIYSTAFGISEPDCQEIAHSLARIFASQIRAGFLPLIQKRLHTDQRCVQLLEYYSRTLST